MKLSINISVASDILKSVDHYESLSGSLPHLDSEYQEKLSEYYHKILNYSNDKRYMDHQSIQYWKEINLYVIRQTWGNTSCGWESIGGSAMRSDYTIIIENVWGGGYFIYYSGKLAYIALSNEKMLEHKSVGFRNLPGINSTDGLDIIYKNKNRK